MLLPGENSSKTWLFVTILVSTIIAFSESGKMLDFNIEFDLTHGSSGAPALRDRDNKGSTEFNPRALDKASDIEETMSDEHNSKSESKERQPHPKKEDSNSKEKDKSDDEDEGGDDGGGGGHDDDQERITRGPKNNDFAEPEEESPSIHAKFSKDSDSEKNSDEDRRRYKRHITHSIM